MGQSLVDNIQEAGQQTSVQYSAEEQAQDFARESNRFASSGTVQSGNNYDPGFALSTPLGGQNSNSGLVNLSNTASPSLTEEEYWNTPLATVADQYAQVYGGQVSNTSDSALHLSTLDDDEDGEENIDTSDPQVVRTRILVDRLNDMKVGLAANSGDDLAPTVANAQELGLYDTSSDGMPVKMSAPFSLGSGFSGIDLNNLQSDSSFETASFLTGDVTGLTSGAPQNTEETGDSSNSTDSSSIANLASGLSIGSRGSQVAALQTALGIQSDGVFGPATQRALSDFNIASDTNGTLGLLSQPYESGNSGVATISSGVNDKGGVSYGAHQLASGTGTMAAFINSPENAAYADLFTNLVPGTAVFNQTYSQVASNDPVAFAQAQSDFITRTHYTPVLQYATGLGFDVADRGVQESLYSQSVQQGYAGNVRILNNVVANNPNITSASPAQQIQAIYAERGLYASQYASSSATTARYAQEVQHAVQISNYYQRLK